MNLEKRQADVLLVPPPPTQRRIFKEREGKSMGLLAASPRQTLLLKMLLFIFQQS